MKSIIIYGMRNGLRWSTAYIPGKTYDHDGNEVSETEEEIEQRLYKRLTDDIRRQEFDKNIIALLQNYLDPHSMENWTNIEIKMSYSDHKILEMNIGNDDNIQWDIMKTIQLLPDDAAPTNDLT